MKQFVFLLFFLVGRLDIGWYTNGAARKLCRREGLETPSASKPHNSGNVLDYLKKIFLIIYS